MISELARKLLRLAAAIEPDGGAAVARRFAEALPPHMRAETGEVVFVDHGRTRRLPLIAPAGNLAADDVLDHVVSRDRVLRFDDISDAARYPETRALLSQRGLRSLLLLPLSTAKDLRAIAILASSRSCAFAGVPSGTTEPLRAMAGIALSASLRMTELRRQNDRMKAEAGELESTNESVESGAERQENEPPDTETIADTRPRRGRRFRFHPRKG
jgi:hypothetical protein